MAVLRRDIESQDYQMVIDMGFDSEIDSLENIISEIEKSVFENDENIVFGIDFSRIKKYQVKALVEELKEILQNKSAELQVF